MRVIMVQPMRHPTIENIGASLREMQDVVGGDIEAVSPWRDDVAIVCNEVGKSYLMTQNRALGHDDVICGTFFICGVDGEKFTDCPDDMCEKYVSKFWPIEYFNNAVDEKTGEQVLIRKILNP